MKHSSVQIPVVQVSSPTGGNCLYTTSPAASAIRYEGIAIGLRVDRLALLSLPSIGTPYLIVDVRDAVFPNDLPVVGLAVDRGRHAQRRHERGEH